MYLKCFSGIKQYKYDTGIVYILNADHWVYHVKVFKVLEDLSNGNITDILSNIQDLLSSIPDILQNLSTLNLQLNNIFDNLTISKAVCGPSKLNIFNILTGDDVGSITDNYKNIARTTINGSNIETSKPSLIEAIISLNELTESECPLDYTLYDGKTCFCAVVKNIIDSSETSKIVFTQLKPLLYGKIIYAPNKPIFKQVIKRMNSTFEVIDEFKKNLDNFETIRSNLTSIENFIKNTFSNITSIDFNSLNSNLDLLSTIAKFAKNFIGCISLDRFVGYSNEEEAVKVATSLETNLWAVVIFDETSNTNDTSLSNKITYKIRMNPMNTHNTFFSKQQSYQYGPNNCLNCNIDFIFGYIFIQDMLEKSIIEVKTNEDYGFAITTQMTPYPCYIDDVFTRSISHSLPLFMVLAWIFTVSMIVKDIVYEKEKRLKEFMRVMGLTNAIHWLAWFLTSFIIMIIICIFLCIMLKYGRIIVKTDLSVLIVFFCCFSIATITQCFLISVFFSRANLAAAAGGIIYFLLYLPYTVLINYSNVITPNEKFLASLSSTVAFSYGCDLLASFEIQTTGINWKNFYESPVTTQDGITMNVVCLILLFDSVIYMFLAWYIETIAPGEFGVAKPFYFIVQPSFWFGKQFAVKYGLTCDGNVKYQKIKLLLEAERKKKLAKGDVGGNGDDMCIKEPMDLNGEKVGIEIIDLHKIYSRGNNYALKGLNVNFYENEITSFLG